VPNSIDNSGPILMRRWVKIKNGATESDSDEEEKK